MNEGGLAVLVDWLKAFHVMLARLVAPDQPHAMDMIERTKRETIEATTLCIQILDLVTI